MVDFGVTDIMATNASEKGAGADGLVLENYDDGHLWARPAVALGEIFKFKAGVKLNLYGNIGNRWYLAGKNTYVTAALLGAPLGVAPMSVPINLGSLVESTVGVELSSRNNISIGAEYSKTLGTYYDMSRFGFHLNIPF